MKRPFEVGDRVAVYNEKNRYAGETIESSYPDSDYLIVRLNNGRIVTAHKKQCRRLVKKERRRIWILPFYVPSKHEEGAWLSGGAGKKPGILDRIRRGQKEVTKTTCSFCKKSITLVDPQDGIHAFCGEECLRLHHLKWHVNQEAARKKAKANRESGKLHKLLICSFLLICSLQVNAHTCDTRLVSYWLNRLERICVHEEQICEALEWQDELENPEALLRWSENLRKLIRAEMETIERDCR